MDTEATSSNPRKTVILSEGVQNINPEALNQATFKKPKKENPNVKIFF